MRNAARAGVVFTLLALGACATSGGTTTIADVDHGADARDSKAESTWRSRCGTCHARVEPGARSREELSVALTRHKKRVRLNEDQWSEMLDFLAPRATASAQGLDGGSPESESPR